MNILFRVVFSRVGVEKSIDDCSRVYGERDNKDVKRRAKIHRIINRSSVFHVMGLFVFKILTQNTPYFTCEG